MSTNMDSVAKLISFSDNFGTFLDVNDPYISLQLLLFMFANREWKYLQFGTSLSILAQQIKELVRFSIIN